MSPADEWLTFYRENIQVYVCVFGLIVCFFGLIGNVLSGIVLSRREMRSGSTVMLLGLTFVDMVCLLTFATLFDAALYKHKILNKWIPNLYAHHMYPISRIGHISTVYIAVLITLERYIAVKWPLRARRFLGVKRSWIAILTVICFSILINVPRWFERMTLENIPYKTFFWTGRLLEFPPYLLYYDTYFWLVAVYIIPFILIVVVNILIWKEVRNYSRSRQEMTSRPNTDDSSLTKMLLTVVFTFLTLNLTSFVLLRVGILFYHAKTISFETLHLLPLGINSSVNFLIYCLMGKKFRAQFFKIFCKPDPVRRGESWSSRRDTSLRTTEMELN